MWALLSIEDAPNKEWNVWLSSFPDRTLCDTGLAVSNHISSCNLVVELRNSVNMVLIINGTEVWTTQWCYVSCTGMSRKGAETHSTKAEAKLGLVPSNILCFYCQALCEALSHIIIKMRQSIWGQTRRSCSHEVDQPIVSAKRVIATWGSRTATSSNLDNSFLASSCFPAISCSHRWELPECP